MNHFLIHNRYALAGLLFYAVVGVSILVPGWIVPAAEINVDKLLAPLARWLAAELTGRVPLERSSLMLGLLQWGHLVLVLGNAWLFWYGTRPLAKYRDAAIVGQGMAGLLLDSLAMNLLCAAQLGALLPWRRGAMWLALLFVAAAGSDMVLLAASWTARSDSVKLGMLAYFSVERLVLALGFGVALLVRSEQRNRSALASANAELLATQALLGDTVRASERLRIARDLHDAAGHHLTALKLHLDLAQRQSDGKAAAALATANQLAGDLLAEVRAVISSERRDEAIDLRAALESLCAGIPRPKIRLDMEEGIRIRSASAAHTLFNCVREALTNAARHANAEEVTITLRLHEGEVLLTVTDNGCGSSGAEGNGLRGMRERLAQHGGRMDAATRAQGGFALDIAMPAAGAGA